MRGTFAIALAVAVMLSVAAPAAAKPKKAKPATLYDRLGGKAAIARVVDRLAADCLSDERINSRFQEAKADGKRLAHFKQSLSDQICVIADGPCRYRGKSMRIVHQGMGIRGEDFDAFLENLERAFDKAGVDRDAKATLMGIFRPMRADILEEKAASNR